jgi:hypothetical protein
VTLEILHVPGCPGADLLAARLETLLAGQPPSLSCRLYPHDQDRPGPAPTLAQLRAALGL